MDNLYREEILDHYNNPRNFGKIKNPTSSFKLYNSACGDVITIDVRILSKSNNKKIIEDIKFQGEGCAISIASASILTDKVKGKNIKAVLTLETADILKFLGIKLTPTRLKCALLPLEVLQKTLALVSDKV